MNLPFHKIKMKTSIILLTLSILLRSASVMGEPQESVSGTPFVSLASTDTTPVTIYAAGHKLVIPRNYLETAQVFMGHSVIGIETTFPDFAGATPSTFAKFNPAKPFFIHDIIIVRRLYSDKSAYESGSKFHIETAQKIKTPNTDYNLIKIPLLGADIRVGLAQPEKESVVISCSLPYVKDIRCTSRFDIAPDLTIDYDYDISLISMWKELDLGVKKLVSSFIQGEK